jgi:pteridine reductase
MQGKVVLVTGGAKRVGAAICRRLHAAGANLVVHYHTSGEAAVALQNELNALRANTVTSISADLLNLSALPSLVAQSIAHFGRLDGLVNNASSFYATPLANASENDWHDLLGTNLKAPLFLAQAAAVELRRNHGGIVNIVDIHAERPMKNHLVYSVAKGGLRALTLGLAQELAPEVRVNGVSPGPILWPEHGDWQDEKKRATIVAQTLLQRVGEPDDIAKTVLFLLQDAPYITGQIIAVDGGKSINT